MIYDADGNKVLNEHEQISKQMLDISCQYFKESCDKALMNSVFPRYIYLADGTPHSIDSRVEKVSARPARIPFHVS